MVEKKKKKMGEKKKKIINVHVKATNKKYI